MNGWILLHRKFFEHMLWEENREFSRAEAWLDLLQMARWKNDEASKIIKGSVIKWKRGQLVASVRFLRKRWGWRSISKVEGFLKLLENEEMIMREKKTHIGRVTICNYNRYQDVKDTGKDTLKTVKGQNRNNGTRSKLKHDQNNRIYEAYPRKVGKKAALKKIEAALKELDADTLYEKTRQFASAVDGKNKKFIPHPSTWFGQGRYLDDPSEWQVENSNTNSQGEFGW
ncbi:hypothetical protein QA596_07880 [Balneolales bacterium ANBcel1]|nr:hypothetical protein [Balneolales bacterium ANBcel1]